MGDLVGWFICGKNCSNPRIMGQNSPWAMWTKKILHLANLVLPRHNQMASKLQKMAKMVIFDF